MKFTYSNSTIIEFGKGKISTITKHIDKNEKVLVVYGGGSIKKNDVYDQIKSALNGYDWTEFSGVEPNPRYETMQKAVQIVKEKGITYVLAVGGGSVVDGSKYLCAAACYDNDGWDFFDDVTLVKKALPLGVVLTLPATGSESNYNAVLTKEATKEKRALITPLIQPRFAVLDPSVMKSLSDRQLANGLADAFIHVCEQYITKPNNSLVHDGYCETLLRGLAILAGDWESRKEETWEENLMLLANQALNGFLGTGVPQDWATHMIGHELTAFYGLDHGQTLCIVQPQLLRVELEAKKAKLVQMGINVFGIESHEAEDTIKVMEKMYQNIGIKTHLKEYGVDDDELIKKVTASLHKKGMDALGENQDIDKTKVEKILTMAM